MESWTAEPMKRVGHIALGADRDSTRKTVGGRFAEFRKTPMSKNTTDDFGSFHIYYDENNCVEAVELFPELEVEVMGKLIFPTSLEDALKALPSLQPDGDGLISIADSVGIYAPDGNMESILFGVEGYYR